MILCANSKDFVKAKFQKIPGTFIDNYISKRYLMAFFWWIVAKFRL